MLTEMNLKPFAFLPLEQHGLKYSLMSACGQDVSSVQQTSTVTAVFLAPGTDGLPKPVNPKGNKPLIFIGRTDAEAEAPTLWPPDMKK